MRTSLLPLTVFSLLAGGLRADHISLTGPGGPLVDNPGPPAGGAWPGALPPVSFLSVVVAPVPITSVTSVVLTGIVHTYVGDLHIVLMDPLGGAHNLMVRPGIAGFAGSNAGDFAAPGQSIAFVTVGGVPIPAAGDIATGVFLSYYGPPGDDWPGGALGIGNDPLDTVVGPAGVWTLLVYDWAPFDVGALVSWTLNGWTSPLIPLCTPGMAGVLDCPCGVAANPGVPNTGCLNYSGTPGGSISATGIPTAAAGADTLVFAGAGLAPTSAILLQGTTSLATGLPFGNGLRCATGLLKRLYVKPAPGGNFVAPSGGDPTVWDRSLALGDMIPSGTSRTYMIYYREQNTGGALGTCSAGPGQFNSTNSGLVNWL